MSRHPTTAGTPLPKQWGFDARMGEVLVRLVNSSNEPFEIRRNPAQAPTIATGVNPEDFTDEVGRVFSQTEFWGGEGREYAHRRTQSVEDTARFWRSYGLELDENDDLKVVNSMEEIVAAPGTAPDPVTRATYNGTALYYSDGTPDLVKVTNLLATSPTTATEVTGLVADCEDVVSIGATVYAAGGALLRNDGGTGTWTTIATRSGGNWKRLWVAKGRIFASDNEGRLFESPTGTVTDGNSLLDLPLGEEWTSLVDAGEFILASATDGTIYSFSFDGTTVALAGQTPFFNEDPVGLGALYGQAFVLTYQKEDDGTITSRFWTGVIDSSGTLSGLQVLREFEGQTEDDYPRTITAAERDRVFWSTYDDAVGGRVVWNYTLGTGAIMSGKYVVGKTGRLTDKFKIEGRFWYVFADGSLYRETTTQLSSGTLVSPLIDFFTADAKPWASLRASARYNNGAARIRISTSTDPDAVLNGNIFDDSYWQNSAVYSADGEANARVTQDASRYFAFRIRVEPDARLESYQVRSLPPQSDDEIILNINISDTIMRPGKKPVVIRNYGNELWDTIRELQNQRFDLEIYDLDTTWRGSIIQVSTPITTWSKRGGVTRTIQVVFRGSVFINSIVTENIWGYGTWGTGLWGLPDETLVG